MSDPVSIDHALSRRTVLRHALAGAGASAVPLSFLSGPPAASAAGAALDLGDRGDLLRAMMKMRFSLEPGVLNMGWMEGKRFSVSEGRVEPLCGMRAATFSLLKQVTEQEFEFVSLEISFYTDFETMEPIQEVVMPFSGSLATVPVHRFGPTSLRFSVLLDETEHFTPAPGTNQAEFATAGSVSMTKSIEVESRLDGELMLRHEEYGRRYPENSDIPTMFYRETTLWSAPEAAVLDPNTATVDSKMAYSAMTSWRPWMKMGDIPGHTFSNGFGHRARSIDALPKAYRDYVNEVHPDVLRDPVALLRAG